MKEQGSLTIVANLNLTVVSQIRALRPTIASGELCSYVMLAWSSLRHFSTSQGLPGRVPAGFLYVINTCTYIVHTAVTNTLFFLCFFLPIDCFAVVASARSPPLCASSCTDTAETTTSSMDGEEDADVSRRNYKAPYTSKHPIPTIQHYREVKKQRGEGEASEDDGQPSRAQAAVETYRNIREGLKGDGAGDGQEAYPSVNHNDMPADGPSQEEETEEVDGAGDAEAQAAQKDSADGSQPQDEADGVVDTTEHEHTSDPKKRRKEIKHSKETGKDREVTDPVTHLPVTIHDFTAKDIKKSPENEPPAGTQARSATGLSGMSKDKEDLGKEEDEGKAIHEGMERLFPPPEYDKARRELVSIYSRSSTVGMLVVLAVMMGAYPLHEIFGLPNSIRNTWLRRFVKIAYPVSAMGLGWLANVAMKGWMAKKMKEVWENEIWEAERQQGHNFSNSQTPESTQWLNSLFASVWPLINPDLFISLSDTLEDVMQASLPKMVRMVSVEDIGQGSEALRILGVRWLPTGAAAKSVTADGKLKKGKDADKSDRAVQGQGEMENTENDKNDNLNDEQDDDKETRKADEQEEENVAEGMEAEEGDFVNMEIAFAYRARRAGTGMKDRSKNAHLYLGFYLPANVKFRKCHPSSLKTDY